MYPIIAEEVYEDGENIYVEGSIADSIFQVVSGAVVISKKVGDRPIIVEVLRAGELFGEVALMGKTVRTTAARAMGRTVVGVVDTGVLGNEFDNLSDPLRHLYQNMADRLVKMTDMAVGISNLRRDKRVAKTWSLVFGDGATFREAYSRDASLGGMFIKTPEPLERGETFHLELRLPSFERPLGIRCEVAWTRAETEDPEQFPVGMGVEFVAMTDEDRYCLSLALDGTYGNE